MEDNKVKDSEKLNYRPKRVKVIKKMIIAFMTVMILLPNIVSVYSLYRIEKVNKELLNMEQQIESLQTETKEVTPAVTESPSKEITEEKTVTKEELTDAERYPGKKLVYLTFDDGPSKYTDDILDILDEYNVKASFFVVAKDGYEDQYRRIVNDGHTLGMHSYTHVYSSIYESKTSFSLDITNISDFLYEITGEKPLFYRFPGGSSNQVSKVSKDDMFDILNAKKLIYYDWNVTSQDASGGKLSATQITDNVISGIEQKDMSVCLMHDSGEKASTVEALPMILSKLTSMDDVVILPITESTEPVHHITKQ